MGWALIATTDRLVAKGRMRTAGWRCSNAVRDFIASGSLSGWGAKGWGCFGRFGVEREGVGLRVLVGLDALFHDEVDEGENVVVVDGVQGGLEGGGDVIVHFDPDAETAEGARHQCEVRVLELRA